MSLSTLAEGITSLARLEAMLAEVDAELAEIQPAIEALEAQQKTLRELKLSKQKLITLRLSLKSIVSNFSETSNPSGEMPNAASIDPNNKVSQMPPSAKQAKADLIYDEKLFLPDQAFSQANEALRQKSSLNYEIFRAIVFHGGQASTEQIKAYLVDNGITQPASGESFETVALSDISARANYLVRKGLVQANGGGVFVSTVGWQASGTN